MSPRTPAAAGQQVLTTDRGPGETWTHSALTAGNAFRSRCTREEPGHEPGHGACSGRSGRRSSEPASPVCRGVPRPREIPAVTVLCPDVLVPPEVLISCACSRGLLHLSLFFLPYCYSLVSRYLVARSVPKPTLPSHSPCLSMGSLNQLILFKAAATGRPRVGPSPFPPQRLRGGPAPRRRPGVSHLGFVLHCHPRGTSPSH